MVLKIPSKVKVTRKGGEDLKNKHCTDIYLFPLVLFLPACYSVRIIRAVGIFGFLGTYVVCVSS